MFRKAPLKKPDWLKVKIPSGNAFADVHETLKRLNLATVCKEARCPNMHECWNHHAATIMILGRICTRACRFCSVTTGDPEGIIDVNEPVHVAEAVKILGLKYVVITSVDRDDIPDLGSSHYARTIDEIHQQNSGVRVEALIPDFNAERKFLSSVVEVRPYILAHNVETVPRLSPYIRDRRCSYRRSLTALRMIKELDNRMPIKSGIMIGLGEEYDEIIETLKDLKEYGVDIVTIGQYLQPTRKHHVVQRYYTPEEFTDLGNIGKELGIKYVVSGPLVRSSYHAAQTVL